MKAGFFAAALILACRPPLSGAVEDVVDKLSAEAAPQAPCDPWAPPELERARKEENLEEAIRAYRAVSARDAKGPCGRSALLELGRLEYGMNRPEAALIALDALNAEDFSGEERAQLMFWRAQSRLVLKGVGRAQDEFEEFLRQYPGHALSDAAALGAADCDAALKNDEAALKGYQRLYEPHPSSVAPQAMFQGALLQLRAGRRGEARQLLSRLASEFPESMEGVRAKEQLGKLPEAPPPPQAAKAPAKTRFTLQVGAYARRAGAMRLFNELKKKGYPVRLEKRVFEDQVLHLIQVGRYAAKAEAERDAQKLKKREKLPYRLVEIKI